MISFVIPVLNEEKSIHPLLEEIVAVCKKHRVSPFEIIFVSDGSTDSTNNVISELSGKHPNVHGILSHIHRGKAHALGLGFAAAKGETIITMDGDGQDDPHELPKLLNKLQEGYDLVSGWKQNRQDPLVKRLSSKVFNLVTRWVTGLALHDYNCGFKAYTKTAARSLVLYGELHRYIPVLLHSNGFRIAEVPVHHRKREYGVSKYGVSRFFHGYFDLFTIVLVTRFRARPLHLFGYIGFVFFTLGFASGVYLTGLKLLYGQSIGQRPLLLLSVMLMIMGVQISVTGLVGEYIIYVLKQKQHDETSTSIETV